VTAQPKAAMTNEIFHGSEYMSDQNNQAPGQPGIPARWTSSAKIGVGTSLNPSSRVWFSLSHGIFDEIYYPRVDQACIRDMGMIVTDGKDFFSEEKRDAEHEVAYLQPGVPAYLLTNTCKQGRYRIEKKILSDPARDAVLQETRFKAMKGKLSELRLHVLLAPHLGNQGADNTAWIGDYKGVPMLFAEHEAVALALACSLPWKGRSVGYVGVSDGWQDLYDHKQMTWLFSSAPNGNVALTGEIDLSGAQGSEASFTLALGFGRNPAEAGQRVLASLQEGFDSSREEYFREWQKWQEGFTGISTKVYKPGKVNVYEISRAVMRTHEAKRFPGGIIASLAIPWGFSKGDDDLGGYHLVWPRDLVEVAGGLLAAGAKMDVRRVLFYLQVTQEQDGHWPQNMWLDGQEYWAGIQMDETAFPILLVEMARREEALNADQLARLWPMVRRAAGYIVRNGPATPQDRWEEDAKQPICGTIKLNAGLTSRGRISPGTTESMAITSGFHRRTWPNRPHWPRVMCRSRIDRFPKAKSLSPRSSAPTRWHWSVLGYALRTMSAF
jgi:glucoamylase